MLEWLAGIGGICLVVGGAIFTFGHKQGKTDQKVKKHDKDIDSLWGHQRVQDERFLEHTTAVEHKLGALEATTTSTAEDVREIRNAVIGGVK